MPGSSIRAGISYPRAANTDRCPPPSLHLDICKISMVLLNQSVILTSNLMQVKLPAGCRLNYLGLLLQPQSPPIGVGEGQRINHRKSAYVSLPCRTTNVASFISCARASCLVNLPCRLLAGENINSNCSRTDHLLPKHTDTCRMVLFGLSTLIQRRARHGKQRSPTIKAGPLDKSLWLFSRHQCYSVGDLDVQLEARYRRLFQLWARL
ncbi:hypothetical protein F5B22DRAFT_472766 [Xylaria bambusicola]|uniref:uncharacterized protein n=1 Tax=Xylaria bambusicola TaxID=326684 RepID=UPI00200830D9|nr:uncharacterized protein F5B22DRAFT_472766 [Xylaria bambusicola]KAI0506233.1 hypothetical protein F5B22DRAFT_472766 [Xylaria bambusicola]